MDKLTGRGRRESNFKVDHGDGLEAWNEFIWLGTETSEGFCERGSEYAGFEKQMREFFLTSCENVCFSRIILLRGVN